MRVDQSERASRAWPVLTKKAHDRELITYGDLANLLDVHPRVVRFVLGRIQEHCLAERLPPLTIVAVDRTGNLGAGFTAYDPKKAEVGREAVYAFPWGSIANPFVELEKKARRWTRDELLIVLNLYEKLRFGQFDSRQPVITQVAKKMSRSPGSLAMKLSNLASFDPKLQARGIVGLQGASNLDREVWAEFQANRDTMVPASEQAMHELFHAGNAEEVEIEGDKGVQIRPVLFAPEGPTSIVTNVMVRRGQQYFRQAVLSVFSGRCGVTGIGVRELLVASHILPWAKYPKARLEPQNGVALSRLHDGAFDHGLISFDENYRLMLSDRLRGHFPHKALEENFEAYEGRPLAFAPDAPAPSQEYLSAHRKEWGFV